ncbi:MAG: DNA alkylation repair protein [Erysipelotrichaceae bacterium]|nr:DNA alkylation repair protein [Erysipelotrichaceae bacterium]
MDKKEIDKRLLSLKDDKYAEFTKNLCPGTDSVFIGVRTADLKALAKEIGCDMQFMRDLPHEYFEEDQLHAFMIGNIRDYDLAIEETERFLPYINNWATCDQLCVRCFKKNKDRLIKRIRKWLKSKDEYTIRFAIGNLMRFYLDDDFREEYPELVAKVRYDTYYVNMMRAWYFATALAKQWDKTIVYLEEKRLDEWTHRKTIQKARESYRISPQHKEYLNALK